MEEHYTANNGFFINNQKVSVIQLIEDGIFHFQELKKENAICQKFDMKNKFFLAKIVILLILKFKSKTTIYFFLNVYKY